MLPLLTRSKSIPLTLSPVSTVTLLPDCPALPWFGPTNVGAEGETSYVPEPGLINTYLPLLLVVAFAIGRREPSVVSSSTTRPALGFPSIVTRPEIEPEFVLGAGCCA